MMDLEIGLGQVLMAFSKGRAPQEEQEFRATVSAKDLPKDEALRRAVIAKLASGELPHRGILVAVDGEYHRNPDDWIQLIERVEVDKNFTAAGHYWEIDRLPTTNVDFYGSMVELTERPSGIEVDEEDFNRPPTFRLKSIRVKAADLRRVKLSGHGLIDPGRGNPGKLAVWHRIYMEFVSRIAEGCPPDDDKAWNELIAGLRQDMVFDIEESAIRKRVQEIRADLRKRGRLQPANKSG